MAPASPTCGAVRYLPEDFLSCILRTRTCWQEMDTWHPLGKLRHAFRAAVCPFCKYVAGLAKDKYSTVNDAQLREYTYGLRRKTYRAEDDLQVPGVECQGLMTVEVWTLPGDPES